MGFHAQFYIISCTQHLSVVLSRYELQNGNSHSLFQRSDWALSHSTYSNFPENVT